MPLYSAYRASKHWLREFLPGIDKDIEDFFSCPIPSKGWRDVKELQSKDFVAFHGKQLETEGFITQYQYQEWSDHPDQRVHSA
jgi:hypothetical protein